MLRRLIALAVCVGGLAICAVADVDQNQQRVRYDGHRLVRAYIQTEAQLETMLSISPDCFNEGIGIGILDFRVPPESMEALKTSGIKYEVLVKDLQVGIDAEYRRLQEAKGKEIGRDEWYDDFRDFDTVVAKMNEIAAAHPDLVEILDIGDSLESRDIWAMRITGPGDDKPAVLYNACQHAREWLTPMSAMFIAEAFANGYGSDPQITGLVDSIEFFIIPVVNPDGYVYSWDYERYWRKNRRDNGDGNFGVDINRNWGVDWGGDGASGYTWDETYYGTAPFSEPETQVMRDFYYAHQNLAASADLHTHGELVIWPWSWQPGPPDDGGLHAMIGGEMAAAITAVHGMPYTAKQGYLLYPVSGGSTDWTWDSEGVISFTIEQRGPDFVVPASEILPNSEENLAGALVLAEASTAGVLYSFPLGLPSIIETDTPTPIEVQIRPIASGDLDHSSAMLYWHVGSGSFTAEPMTHLGDMSYEATLPGIACGETIEYYFEIGSTAGETYSSPQDAPDGAYTAEAFDIKVDFHDDFEADLGWTVEDSMDLTDGSWDRGVPVGGGDRGDPPTDADGSGQCYLTDNVDDNSDVDGGTTTLYSPTLDASDPESMISYHRWYSNNFGGAPYEDVFVVDVSDDNGTTWNNLETVGPDGPEVGGGWYHREFVIAEIPDITNTDEFMIRFAASDLGSGSVVEAAVDGVMIRTIGCDDVLGDITGDGVVDVLDLLELLSAWGPCPDCPEDLNGDGVVDVLDLLILLSEWS